MQRRVRIFALVGVLGLGALMGTHGHDRLHQPAHDGATPATVLVGQPAAFLVGRPVLGVGATRPVRGRLGLVGGGQCVGFAHTSRLIVFPPGTTSSGSGRHLVVSVDGVELHLGSRIRAASPMTARPQAPLGRLGVASQAPRGCRRLLATTVDGFR